MASVPKTPRSILSSASVSAEISTAFISLASSIEQVRTKCEETAKEIEVVRKLARTNWLLVFNLPLPAGVGKGQALQNLFEKLGYGKPLFDHDRDLLATDMIYVNRSGSTCNLAFFVVQRHYDYILSAPFQKKILQHNIELERGLWVSFGRVLTPQERADFDVAQALKRLLNAKMRSLRAQDPSYAVQFVLVDKSTLRIRVDKTEKTRYRDLLATSSEKRKSNKRKAVNRSESPAKIVKV